MKCIIAEKPSVGRDLARAVGATTKGDGYIEGNGYIVTWAVGHLVGLAEPEVYGFGGAYRAEDLPMRPSPFRLSVRQVREGKTLRDDPKAARQLEVIRKCFERSEGLIVATDAGREGELIFRYIYEYLGCRKPFERLWISSLTERAIRDGLASLQPGGQYDNLYHAARARSEADWLVGMNASRALSISQAGFFPLGRVQTPTLGMVCRRFVEHGAFKRVPFWRLRARIRLGELDVWVSSEERFSSLADAEAALATLRGAGQLEVTSAATRTTRTPPPLLYDLTTLQREANRRHGLTAEQTLVAMQSLYETDKVCTYPRTGSRHIGEDVFERVPELLGSLGHDVPSPNRRSVDGAKVTDHHAIIVTGQRAEGLTGDRALIYAMVSQRFVEAFSPDSEEERMRVVLSDGAHTFVWRGVHTVSPGWRAVGGGAEEAGDADEEAGPEEEAEQELSALPDVAAGGALALSEAAVSEHSTKPKPIHTEASLLAAMEHAGREAGDADSRRALAECGLGTPATRASILETLIRRGYIQREKKRLVPTEKGLGVYEIVRDRQIANVEMTGRWEQALAGIAEGRVDVEEFNRGIHGYVGQICGELLALPRPERATPPSLKCPKCGAASVRLYPKVASCRAEGCDFHVFRQVCGHTLTEAQVEALLGQGRTPVLRGLVGKSGKKFNARLALNEDLSTRFEFEEHSGRRGKK